MKNYCKKAKNMLYYIYNRILLIKSNVVTGTMTLQQPARG